MRTILFMAFFTVACCGCAHKSEQVESRALACPSAEPPAPDISLITPWTFQKQAAEKLKPPFTTRFRSCGRELLYISASHASSASSPTFMTVKNVIEEERPDYVILEGFPSEWGDSPQRLIKIFERCANEDYRSCGEPVYGAVQAFQRSIPFTGGEPAENKIKEKLIQDGFSAEDLLGYYVVRMIPEWRREGDISRNEMESRIAKYIKASTQELSVRSSYGINDFYSWYWKRTHIDFDPDKIVNNSIAPSADASAPFINRFAHRVDLVRDQAILELIWNSLKQHRNVLVVYGAGHFVKQKPALKKMMGEPEYLKSF